MGHSNAKTCLWAHEDREDSDQCSLIRALPPCPLAESMDTTECMNGEQRPG